MSVRILVIYAILSIGLNMNVTNDRFVLLPFLPQRLSVVVIKQ